MKKLFWVGLCFMVTLQGFSQSLPFHYQAVARDSDGGPMPNSNISLRFSILQGGSTGSVVYSETHGVVTTNLGMMEVNIGQGNATSGDFGAIDWSMGAYFLKTDVDIKGGQDFSHVSTTMLKAVPFALYALESGSLGSIPQHEWQGSELRFEIEPGVFGDFVDLRGEQGPQGEPGPQGEEGMQGEPGSGLRVVGSVGTVADLPTIYAGSPGDLFLTQDDGNGHVWDGSAFRDIGQIKGPQGEQGPQGERGSSIQIVGAVSTATDLPIIYEGQLGDLFLSQDDGHGHVWDGTMFDDIGQFAGPPGEQGPQGDPGEIGPEGPQGIGIQIVGSIDSLGDLPEVYEGLVGDLFVAQNNGHGYVWDGSMFNDVGQLRGPRGEQGPRGDVGEIGPEGPQGQQGVGIQIVGSVGTAADLPGIYDGQIGDLLLSQNDGHGHAWDGAMFNDIGPIRGPVGEQGPQGDTGETGPIGPQGPQGVGIQIVGSVDSVADLPANYNGLTGDLFIAQDNGHGYVWEDSIFNDVGQLRGPRGEQGIKGEMGDTGPEGPQGPQGIGIQIVGSVGTVADLPVVYEGQIGDLILTQDNGHGHVWDGSMFNDIGQIKGPQGEQGLKGDAGEAPAYVAGAGIMIEDSVISAIDANLWTVTSQTNGVSDIALIEANAPLEANELSSGDVLVDNTLQVGASGGSGPSVQLQEVGYVAVFDSLGLPKSEMFLDGSTGVVLTDDLRIRFRSASSSRAETSQHYGAITGPELAVYHRGTAQLVDGELEITFEADFLKIASLQEMTVQLTPQEWDTYGLAVTEKTNFGFKVKELKGGVGNFSFDWEVKCKRKGKEDFHPVKAAIQHSENLGKQR